MITGTLTELLLAAFAFAGGHFLLSSTPLRAMLAGRFGEKGFQGVFSLFAGLALVWLIWSYAAAPLVAVWDPPVWTRHLSLTLMPFVLILFVAAMRKDNPTAGSGGPGAIDVRRLGVFAITRHPMMWAFALWAILHLLANGDAASMIFFGTFIALSLGGTVAIDTKKRARKREEWRTLAARTSNLPFAAILSGRTRFSTHRMLRPALIGLGLYVILLLLHPLLFGVDPLAP
jgi:uncharacterized membrane protein